MVLALVLLPALAVATAGNGVPATRILFTLLVTLAKVSVFVAIMLIVGRRVIPWLMHFTAHTGSRELFRLAVYAIALGVAYGAAHLFGVSFALGAFFAGMVLGESDLSQRAAEEAIPLRDAFAVLFFVSVGMLLDPAVFVEHPLAVIATIAIIIVGKSVAAYVIVRAFGHSRSTAFTVSASLAQIGEFSFILIGIGIGLGMVPKESRDLILAGAIVSIMLNPLIFTLLERMGQEKSAEPAARPDEPATALTPTTLTGHDIVVGYGRVGSLVGAGLRGDGARMIVVEASDAGVARARGDGAEVFTGNAAEPAIIAALNLAGARRLYVTIPEVFEAGQIVQQARAANPKLDILARAHSRATVEHFEKLGANLIVLGETEIAHRMLERGRADTSTIEL